MAKQVKQAVKPKKETNTKENIGKVFINLGQLIFGTLFLGSVLRGELPQYLMMAAGFVSALIFIVFGILLSAKERKNTEE